MRPTEELKEEHRAIEKVLRALIVASKRMQKGEEVDPQFFRRAVDFVRTFADKCHHGKEEDTLFPVMERHGQSRDGGLIGLLLVDHEEGRAHVQDIANALDKYEGGDKSPAVRIAITSHAIGYARMLAGHIEKEDKNFFITVDDLLPAAEQEALSATFAEVEARVVGPGKHEEYVRLAAELEEEMQAQGTRL